MAKAIRKTGLARLWQILASVAQTAFEKHLGLIAAGVAFFGVFGIFPGIAALIAIFGLVSDPLVIDEQLYIMEDIIPPGALEILSEQVVGLANARTETLGWTTILSTTVALWASRAGVGALVAGLNAIAGQRLRNGLWQIVVGLMLTGALIVLSLIAMGLVIVLPLVLRVLPLSDQAAWIIEALRWTLALCALLIALSLLYRFAPARTDRRAKWITVGAFVVVMLWVGASSLLNYYLSNFNSYNQVYGSIGAVIGLLLWLYISAYLILLGAALNVEIHGHGSPPARNDADVLPEPEPAE